MSNQSRDKEEGSIIVIVALTMTILLGMAALSLDIGCAYLQAGQLQKAVDAAVYSVGRQLPVNVNDEEAQNAIKDSAISYAALNGVEGLNREDVLLEGVVSGFCTEIKVEAAQTVNLNFARVLGLSTLDFTRSARAKLSPLSKATSVAPLGVINSELQTRIENGDLRHIVLKYGSGGGTQSSFGALDLDGKGGGASDYRLWLSYGYPGEVCVGDILIEESGNIVGPTYQGFSARYDACTHYNAQNGGEGCIAEHYDPTCPRIVKVVVYTSGDSKTVTVEGFAAFLLEDQTNDGYITGTFLDMVVPGTTSGKGLEEASYYGLSNLMLTE
ncbi:MAG: Tad domain-containing protein [Syntrophaceticus schinkii]|nr:Tad domain-containing protein [Clostridia bacterium]MDD4262799.1 Tad domain-containing protein [Syntrophaceticus schinkii]MDD4400752.1 Tad domain-containing protein [Desulfitobacteriaceae bacterium]